MSNFNPDFAVAESACVSDLLAGCIDNDRANWVSHQFGHGELILFQDGLLLKYICKEAVKCFVDGQFVATVLLAFSLIERSIAGRLLVVGETKARKERVFEELLNQAEKMKWISPQEKHDISSLCAEYRNSLAHIRLSTESERHEVRGHEKGKNLCEVIESDAYYVLGAAFNILKKASL